MIPNCYEAYAQEEQRQRVWDEHLNKLPNCAICGRRIMEGEDVHETRGKSVCGSCMEELTENKGCVEIE